MRPIMVSDYIFTDVFTKFLFSKKKIVFFQNFRSGGRRCSCYCSWPRRRWLGQMQSQRVTPSEWLYIFTDVFTKFLFSQQYISFKISTPVQIHKIHRQTLNTAMITEITIITEMNIMEKGQKMVIAFWLVNCNFITN